MSKKSKITKRELAAILRESVVAPNKSGPLKVIIDVGDPRYYMQRTLELVTLSLTSPTVDQQEYYLEQAIFLLGVAKYTIRTNQKKVSKCDCQQAGCPSHKTGELDPDKLEALTLDPDKLEAEVVTKEVKDTYEVDRIHLPMNDPH